MPKDDFTSTALAVLPKELRIEKRVSHALRSGLVAWLPIIALSPLAFMVEAIPAAIGILLIVGLTTRELRRARGDLLPLLELADRGDAEEAVFRVAQMAKKERNWRRKAFLVGVLSNLELRAGRPESAEALARESVRYEQPQNPALTRSLHANLAVILALRGDVEEALELLPSEPVPDPVTDGARMLVWAVDGRWQELADYAYVRLPQMQGMRHNNRIMALCKAMALHETGGGVLTMERYLDQARPRLAGEYDYLIPHWPSLRDFLAAHPALQRRRTILERA